MRKLVVFIVVFLFAFCITSLDVANARLIYEYTGDLEVQSPNDPLNLDGGTFNFAFDIHTLGPPIEVFATPFAYSGWVVNDLYSPDVLKLYDNTGNQIPFTTTSFYQIGLYDQYEPYPFNADSILFAAIGESELGPAEWGMSTDLTRDHLLGYPPSFPTSLEDSDISFISGGVAGGLFYAAFKNVELSVPEPATMLLLGSGLIGLAGFRRKIKR